MEEEVIEYNEENVIVSFDTAKLAKQKGFNYECIAKYCKYSDFDKHELFLLFPESQNFFKGYFNFCKNEDSEESKYAAPTQSLLFEYLMRVHDIIIWYIPASYDENKIPQFVCFVSKGMPSNGGEIKYKSKVLPLNEALEKSLQEALKLIVTNEKK